ncbi:hypothetical protein BASA50_002328 [Batrachochytrium salamandrivorans]|uniref:Major facilitator superfamily (MFS) profile domain-containing protein n=1 Tax=Batrachochytrium salamandrivorans TaxID=1357716 RepID=A0ABQ8FN10_9FUNG|nr:hypothetical protein BASA60_004538 [Batrachochytrium salamandrivorans]KAH6600431.1 hypothetical protein BASA50_002328 [Batrachochytrium salamandrivorans]KAH9267255.1 hypothetical protein BASA84_000736 [Batrachochytrium salamandrivorans]
MPDGSAPALTDPAYSSDMVTAAALDVNERPSSGFSFIELHDMKPNATIDSVDPEIRSTNSITDSVHNLSGDHADSLGRSIKENYSLDDDTVIYAEADSSYGWVIVAAGFMINVVTIALPASYGVFQQAYKELPEFAGASSVAIAFIGSLGGAGLPLFSIPAGHLSDKYGPRIVCLSGAFLVFISMMLASFSTALWQMIITQGLLFGIGTSLSHIPGISILPDWFIKRRGLATGIAVAGSGLGGLMLGPVLRILISNVGWRWTLRIISLAGGSILALCSLFLRVRTFRKPSKRSHFSNFKDPIFLRLYGVAVIYSFAYFVPFFYIPTYVLKFGMNIEQGALLVGILSGASGLGRVTLGFASDYIGHINTLTGCLVLSTLSILLIWPFSTSFGSVLIFVLVYGYFIGGFICLTSTVTAQLFGAKGNIATVTGMIFNGYLFGDLFGTPIAGAIIDHFTKVSADGTTTVDYIPSILFAGSCFAIGSILLMSIKMTIGKRRFYVKI